MLDIEALERRVESLQTRLEAWQSVFGTSQLSHAQARLEAAERKVESLQAELTLEKQTREDQSALGDERIRGLEKELATRDATICGMREYHLNRGFCSLDSTCPTCTILEEAPACPHEDEATERQKTIDLMFDEVRSLQAQLAAKDHEFQQAKEAIAHLEKGKPLGQLVGKQIIVNQTSEISILRQQLATSKEKVLNQFEDMCVRRGIRPEFAVAAIRGRKEIEDGSQ